jgi:hypothetical protein
MRIKFLTSVALLSGFASPAWARASEAAEPFVASREPATFDRAVECLTQAVYYEARSESEDGQRAVAQVVLNRVRHPAYPNSVCGVVYQGSERVTGCQFTFTCDGSLGRAIEPYAWDRARRIATAALSGNVYRPVGLATNYHTTAISPYWAPSLVPQVTLGNHIFYRRPGSGTAEAFSQAPAADDPDWVPQTRQAGLGGGRRASTVSYEMPVYEIPVVERPVLLRSIGGRRAAASSPSGRPVRTAAARTGTRVSIEGGVRVYRSAGVSN